MTPTRIVRADLDGAAVDVLVVGGGITGAAIAYEAASRGLSVALVEQHDVGAATSAATGKLIHGGLRYLKNLEVGLVRESLAERRTLMRIAPNLVSPIAMVLPDPGLVEHLGLTAYDLLSFDRNRLDDPSKRIPAHRSLSRSDLDGLGLPFVDRGILYSDAMMLSPERLTLAFLRSAVAAGAVAATRTRVVALTAEGSRVTGAEIEDAVTGATGRIRARVTVNATGSWARDVLLRSPATAAIAGPAPSVRSEGIYLVTRPLTETMVLTVTPHGHFSFAPWRGHTLIGPTETPYRGPVDEWRLTRASVEAFLERIAAAGALPTPIGVDDVVAAYGGLRPLTETAGDDTYRASRASELRDHRRDGVDGLLSATGGKYTNSRAFAESTVGTIARMLGTTVAPSRTARTPLDGCDVPDVGVAVRDAVAAAAEVGIAEDSAALLASLYGSDLPALLALVAADPRLATRATTDGELLAGVAYAARYEAPESLSDILLRRTGIGTLGDPGDDTLALAATLAAELLGWDAPRRERELADARTAVRLPTA